MTNLSAHFTVEEFTASSTAARHGLDNSLPGYMMEAAKNTAEMMERIRTHLSVFAGKPCPIIITSGFRSPELNKLVGSSPTSDHRSALAVDFKSPTFGTPYDVCKALVPVVEQLNIGQIILEFGQWVHVSTRIPDKVINRIITINSTGTKVGIVKD